MNGDWIFVGFRLSYVNQYFDDLRSGSVHYRILVDRRLRQKTVYRYRWPEVANAD